MRAVALVCHGEARGHGGVLSGWLGTVIDATGLTGAAGGAGASCADPYEAESYRVLRSRIDLSGLPPLSRAVTERVLCATADFDYVTDLVCDERALVAGAQALASGAAVVADAATVAVGITGYPVTCKAAESLAARLARTAGITVAAAGIRLGFGECGPGAVWVVGSAPDAVAEILRRAVEPALVIAFPVGFTGAAAMKDELRASGLPALTNVSEKGGAPAAIAAFTALLQVAKGDPLP